MPSRSLSVGVYCVMVECMLTKISQWRYLVDTSCDQTLIYKNGRTSILQLSNFLAKPPAALSVEGVSYSELSRIYAVYHIIY